MENVGDLFKVLAAMSDDMPVILEGKGALADWRGEVCDGKNVLVLYAGEAPHWRPAVNGNSAYPWLLIWSDESVPVRDRYYCRPAGSLIRFASNENAQRMADKLNAQAKS